MAGEAYIDHNRKFVAFWSPKCACSAVVVWFAKGILANPDVPPTQAARPWLSDNGYYSGYPEARRCVTEFGYKSAIFARHPATRLVSAFINKFVNYGRRSLIYFDDLEGFSRELARNVYQSLNKSIDQYKGITFNEFLDYLERAIHIDGTPLNNHWDTQIPRPPRRPMPECNVIVKTESFNSDLKKVNSLLGIKYMPPKINATSFNAKIINEDLLLDVPSSDIARLGQIVGINNFLTADVLDRIHHIYKIDYDFFDYEPALS